jgi:hypothetical protein
MPEFEVTVITTRIGTHTVLIEAASAAAASELVRGECDRDESHCPPEWCTDDVQSEVASVREIAQRASRILNRSASLQVGCATEHDRTDGR